MRSTIEAAWENRELLKEQVTIDAINHVIEDIDKGILRVAEPTEDGEWIHDPVCTAVFKHLEPRRSKGCA